MTDKELTPNEGNVRKVKHVRFEHYVEEPDPISGKTRLARRVAKAGDVVEIPREVDRELGARHGAFFTDEELKAVEAPQGEVPVAEKSDQQLIDWISEDKPNVDDTVGAAGTDPDLAQRILDAETAATGGDPREGVLKGLTKVIDNATE